MNKNIKKKVMCKYRELFMSEKNPKKSINPSFLFEYFEHLFVQLNSICNLITIKIFTVPVREAN